MPPPLPLLLAPIFGKHVIKKKQLLFEGLPIVISQRMLTGYCCVRTKLPVLASFP